MPVLPIVPYDGDPKWTAATEVAALIPRVPGSVAKYLPKLEYLLVDESRYIEGDLAGLKNGGGGHLLRASGERVVAAATD